MRNWIGFGVGITLALGAAYCYAKDICEDYASRVPNLAAAQCRAAQLKDTGTRSVKGRTIWSTDISMAQPRMRVLVIGGIHGDEMSSVATVFHWIGMTQRGLSDVGAPVHWRFIPSLNPDGLFAKPSSRVNANGVDLNRNFPTPHWDRDARRYWERTTGKDPRRWPGKRALSEPESRLLNDQMQTFRPNLIVSVHAPFGLLDFDGPTKPPTRLGRLYLDQVGIYPGSLGNYGGVHRGLPVVTVELPNAAVTPHDDEMQRMWTDLLNWTAQRLTPSVVASSKPTP